MGVEVENQNQGEAGKEHSSGERVESPRPAQIDGYWLRMARLSLESLSTAIRPDLTELERNAVVEYLGGILDDAFNSGIRLGGLQSRLTSLETVTRERDALATELAAIKKEKREKDEDLARALGARLRK